MSGEEERRIKDNMQTFAWAIVVPLIRDIEGRGCFEGKKGVQCVRNFVLHLPHLRCLQVAMCLRQSEVKDLRVTVIK